MTAQPLAGLHGGIVPVHGIAKGALMAWDSPRQEWLGAVEQALDSEEGRAAVARTGRVTWPLSSSRITAASRSCYTSTGGMGSAARSVSIARTRARRRRGSCRRLRWGDSSKILDGEIDPMQAMVTRNLRVEGPMAYILRNVPIVLDFVRVARSVPIEG